MLRDAEIEALARRRSQSIGETRLYAERQIRRAVRDSRAGIHQTLDNIIEPELRREAARRVQVLA